MALFFYEMADLAMFEYLENGSSYRPDLYQIAFKLKWKSLKIALVTYKMTDTVLVV